MSAPLLTRKQHLYLRQFAAGWSTDEIGRYAGANGTSVANTIERARRRLGARHNAHLVALAVAHGILEPHVIRRDVKIDQPHG